MTLSTKLNRGYLATWPSLLSFNDRRWQMAVEPRFPRSPWSPLLSLGCLGVPGAFLASCLHHLASVRYRFSPKRLVGQVLPLAPQLLVSDAGTTTRDPAQNIQEVLRKVRQRLGDQAGWAARVFANRRVEPTKVVDEVAEIYLGVRLLSSS